MSTGVKVVGAVPAPPSRTRRRNRPANQASEEEAVITPRLAPTVPSVGRHRAPDPEPSAVGDVDPAPAPVAARPSTGGPRRHRLGLATLVVVAVGGLIGTIAFGTAWSSLNAERQGQAQVEQSARSFLNALTNFSAKTVDADFGAITTMATGPFASQAQKFFNSAIRQELETALAVSQGQIRSLYVETDSGNQASVYGVVDQLYSNDKVTTPQADVLRVVVNLTEIAGIWKIADVTVLSGPELGGSTTTPSTAATTPAG